MTIRVARLLCVAAFLCTTSCGTASSAFKPGVSTFPVIVELEQGQSISVTDPDNGISLQLLEGDIAIFDYNGTVLSLEGHQIRPGLPARTDTPPSRDALLSLLATVPRMQEVADGATDNESLIRAYQTWMAEKAGVAELITTVFRRPCC